MEFYSHMLEDDEAIEENAGEIPSDGDACEDDEDADGEDEAGSAIPIKLAPKKRTVTNPRNTLNAAKLCGPRGIIALESHFKGLKPRGKRKERAFLDDMMRRYEHWAHRLYPKYHFDDCVTVIEKLGQKREVKAYMDKYRMGIIQEELAKDKDVPDDSDDEAEEMDGANRMNQPVDPLDSMLDEQIAISRGRSLANTSGIGDLPMDTTFDAIRREDGPRPSASNTSIERSQPQTSKDTRPTASSSMSEEIRAKIEANRLRAMEIRKARLLALSQTEKED